MTATIPLARPWRAKPILLNFCLAAIDKACAGAVRFVQVGAHDGSLADPIRDYATSGWRGIMIEPHPVYFAELNALHGARSALTLVNCAVSDIEASFDLYHLAESQRVQFPDWARGCASMSRARLEEVLSGRRLDEQRVDPDRDIAAVRVAARRLDTILAEAGAETADFLIVDVEGWELNVLNSVDLDRLALRAALIECNGPDRTQEAEIAARLKAAGFETFRLRDDLLALHPERASVPLGDVLTLLGQPHLAGPDPLTKD